MKKINLIFIIMLVVGCDKTITHKNKVIYQSKKNYFLNKQFKDDDNKEINKNFINEKVKNDNLKQEQKLEQEQKNHSEKTFLNINENKNDELLNNALNKNSILSALAVKEGQFSSKKEEKKENLTKNNSNKELTNNVNNKTSNNSSVKKTFKIQCGNYTNKQVANELANKIKNSGINDVVVLQENGTNKVLVGSFATKDEGANVRNALKKLDFIKNEFWVYK